MQPYLENSPGYAPLQGEWEKHGNCAFKTTKDYYQKQQELFDKLILPTEEKNTNQIEQFIKQNNLELKFIRFSNEKNEIKICYDRNWKYRNCPEKQLTR